MENQYDIDVQVETAYVSEHSEPDEDRFVFAYTITLVNRGSVTAQLISRHWFITDADNRTEEVEGEGVVGEQPVLKPCILYTTDDADDRVQLSPGCLRRLQIMT